ncbi:MAG: 2-dehydropantoate 2-reductase N-terminal domain-containing protein, partial [Pseudomonadota bacterium]|nr:2-dehydropantoate 2-reductase N-terminal domain-containing protein [Pseudomonadota bacterium]
MGKQIFIFGLGYIGEAFAAMMAEAGYEIAGTVRTPQKLSHRAAEGWKIYPYQHTEQPVPKG